MSALPQAVDAPSRCRRGPLAAVLLVVFRAWQLLRAGRPSPCRFVPTCSAYGIEAVQVHGAWRGVALTARRLLRCNPWGPYGYDPVPSPVPRNRKVPS